MKNPAPTLDKDFIARQKTRLLTLQKEMQRTLCGEENDEATIQSQAAGEAREFEDDAQKLTNLEVAGLLANRSAQRLAALKHALQKIEDGTYGISDASGRPISRDRLEALPEASSTLDEEKAAEAKG